ncbi:MAG TPA: nucleotidyltransferase family protein [Candidatus Sulfopaludibacter sp.]|nr:nucleotidyltransferase family protein [Candidatus Sulfopaludibacter sp.]
MTPEGGTAGLILAAGESRRMGYPKALLRYRQETFLDTLVGLFAERCDPVIVVLGCRADEIRGRAVRPATFVVNTGYQRGMTSSLQYGLRAAPPETSSVLLTLVDHPAVTLATIDALMEGEPFLRVPRYKGRRGHPIRFAGALIPEFLGLSEAAAARDVVRSHAAETEFLDLDDSGIVADIDDLDAYRGLIGATL